MLPWLLPLATVLATVGLSIPLGRYMHWALDSSIARQQLSRFDYFTIHVLGASIRNEQTWKQYCSAMLVFNALMFTFVYSVLMLQNLLPLNPDRRDSLEPSLAFHTAASFTSNTNLQHYSGEVSLSYFSQIAALMWLQFVSAATGIATLTAICRGLAGRRQVGNFFHDVWRATVLVLLPLSAVWGIAFAFLGIPMTFDGSAIVTTLEGSTQSIARGPVAAFVAIKQLGTNGGGFFGPNATHPFENPGFWSNVLATMAIVLIPMACVWMFGHIIQRMRHAAVVFAVMLSFYGVLLLVACICETEPTRALTDLPIADSMNLEGKELRFGTTAGPLWAVSTTSTSNGSVNAMHDSLNPLTGLVPMIGMWLNVVFGGVGVGLINMFLFVITTVFLAGMMVGRTPEYLARKVEVREMKLALIALLAHPTLILGGIALFVLMPWGPESVKNVGSHGFSEIAYEFSSATANNGSGFEGLGDNTLPWNIATGIIMLLARFVPIIIPLAMVGSLAAKRPTPESAGTFRVDTATFGLVLAGTIIIIGALLFLPLAVLGPIAEHLANV